MFSEVCVILFTVGMGTCIQRGLHLAGLHPEGWGSASKGRSASRGVGGLHPGGLHRGDGQTPLDLPQEGGGLGRPPGSDI